MLFENIEKYSKEHMLFEPNDVVVIGLSGGPDSVFLTRFLHSIRHDYNLTLIAAHLDHGWRDNSFQDALFCKEFAEQLNIAFVSAHAKDIIVDKPRSGSKEDLGRQLRRAFFEQVAHEHGAHKIALAHHRDDQIETFFIRLLRGAGLTGLSCMRPRNGLYIRPLLELRKAEILTYLEKNGHAYLLDYTNKSDEFLRNRIRNYVIPALNATDARFEESCLRSIHNLQEADDYIGNLTITSYNAITKQENGIELLDISKLKKLHPFLQKRVLLHWLVQEKVPVTISSSLFDEIFRFLYSPRGGKHELHPSWSIVKQKQLAFIDKN